MERQCFYLLVFDFEQVEEDTFSFADLKESSVVEHCSEKCRSGKAIKCYSLVNLDLGAYDTERKETSEYEKL